MLTDRPRNWKHRPSILQAPSPHQLPPFQARQGQRRRLFPTFPKTSPTFENLPPASSVTSPVFLISSPNFSRALWASSSSLSVPRLLFASLSFQPWRYSRRFHLLIRRGSGINAIFGIFFKASSAAFTFLDCSSSCLCKTPCFAVKTVNALCVVSEFGGNNLHSEPIRRSELLISLHAALYSFSPSTQV